MSLTKRYDFVLIFDVKDGNPNGDPDAGNLPRVDAETGFGLVTDVCLKRKVRNFVALTHEYKSPNNIYIREKSVLGRAHTAAFRDLDFKLGEESRAAVPKELLEAIEEVEWCDGISVEEDDEKTEIVISTTSDKKELKKWAKELEADKRIKKLINDAINAAKPRKPTEGETESGREWMCKNYFDVRTFGAVMSLKSAPNCGQVRGPVQMTFARSVDRIATLEHSITVCAARRDDKPIEEQIGIQGRKFTVPYGLYVAHGFVSAHLAKQTGFSADDLELLWQALINMFEHDRAAARGLMSTQGLYVFEHESALGNAPAQQLFARIKAERKPGVEVPRSFADYQVTADDTALPAGITLHRLLG
jgi:CRISPR-associated protein Csd2